MKMEENFATAHEASMRTILLVDDSPVNLGVVVESLEAHGYDLLVAQDGEEALQRIEVAMPDLILLDVMMPGMDGFEVCRRLKAQPHTQHIPVIFMTSLSAIDDKVKGFEAGAVDYVTKPLQVDEVRVRINTHLNLRALQKRLETKNAKLRAEISERERMQAELSVREQEVRTLVENSPDTIARYGNDCRRRYVNPAFGSLVEGGVEILLGKTPMECPGGPNADLYELKIQEVFATGTDAEFELKWNGPEGREMCSLIRLTAERDMQGTITSVLGVGRDITELNEHRKRVYQMAFYDGLTSLPNRALFNDRLRQMITDAEWHGQKAGVMLLDLDRFKAVNDTMGHPAGDELLREAAARLTYCVRGYDTVARLGGDEFAILLPEIRMGDDLARVAGKILEAFNDPFLLEGREVFLTASVGISLYPDDSLDGDDLLKQADSAMYFAKRSGRNNFRFYSSDLTVSATERMTLEGELRRGMTRGELELYYQPKVDLQTGAVIGSEALLRWNHPMRGMVPPDKFIGIAEDSGLIVEIGEWVLRSGCEVARDWNRQGGPLHRVAINLSSRQFQSGNLAKTMRSVLEKTGCAPEWIELEITESLLLDTDDEVLEILKSFRMMGITIAIDDFGTGYSALSYLARFPIDTLKIDRSFTSKITEQGHHAELVKAIISIAHSLHQKVVAEGVETLEQAALLQAYGCHLAQGYLYSRPVCKSAFEALPQKFSA